MIFCLEDFIIFQTEVGFGIIIHSSEKMDVVEVKIDGKIFD